MDNQQPETSASERETIQDEIKRIQLALQGRYGAGSDDEVSEGSDEDALNIDTDDEDNEIDTSGEQNLSQGSLQDTSASFTEEQDSLDMGEIIGEIVHPFASLELVNFGDSTNYLTCLALNRAYQELITACLKRIDVLLTSNTEKQEELGQELEDRVTDKTNPGVNRKYQLSTYGIPYFKDPDGMHPPSNADVKLKSARAEVRAHQMRPSVWKQSHKDMLKKAVLADAREKLLRPYMNRKEIEAEKLQAAQKETEECEFRLKNLTVDTEEAEEEEEEEEEDHEEDDVKAEDWESEGESEEQKNPAKKASRKTQKAKIKEIRQAALKGAKDTEKAIRQKIQNITKEMIDKSLLPESKVLQQMDPQRIDWLKISTIEFDGRWDSVTCQQMWTNVISPQINRTKWSKEENANLLKLVEQYDKRNWPRIAQELGTRRTPFQCLQHYELKLNVSQTMKPWTPEEDALLIEVVTTCRMGNNIPWTQVAFYMEDKLPTACNSRYTQLDPSLKKGRWSADEDAILITEIYKHGTKHWNLISAAIPSRTSGQCRERWTKALNPNIRMGQWTYDEDKQLLKLLQEEKNSYIRVASRMNGRTNSQIRKRHGILKKWQKDKIWLDQQSEETRKFLMSKPPDEVIKSLKEILKRNEYPVIDETTDEEMFDQEASEVNCSFRPAPEEHQDLTLLVQCPNLFQDYIRQQKDKAAGDIVVPRPPISKHSTRKCIQRLQLKEELRRAVLSKAESDRAQMRALTMDEDDAEEAQNIFPRKLSEESCQLLRGLHPSMSVREIIQLSRFLTGKSPHRCLQDIPNSPKRRRKATKTSNMLDNQLKQAVLNESLGGTPLKKRGRRRRYFPLDASSVPDPEEIAASEAKTSAVLFKALNVDSESAWDKLQGEEAEANTDDVEECLTGVGSRDLSKTCLTQLKKYGMVEDHTTADGDSVEPGCSSDQAVPSGAHVSPNEDNSRNILPLPPSFASLTGFRSLLLNRKVLLQNAGTFHQPRLYNLRKKSSLPAENNSGEEDSLENTIQVRDPLSKIRESKDFKLFQSRFNSVFLWPAFLSTVQKPKNSEEENAEVKPKRKKYKYPMTGKTKFVPFMKQKAEAERRERKLERLREKEEEKNKASEENGEATETLVNSEETPGKKRRGRPVGSRTLRNKLLATGQEMKNERPSARLASKSRINYDEIGAGKIGKPDSVKHKRQRKRKLQQPSTSFEGEVPVKRKRGRPRKYALEQSPPPRAFASPPSSS